MPADVRPAVAVAVLAGALGAGPAAAQESGFYLGATIGEATFVDWCVDSPLVLACDDTDTAWKLVGGYRFNRYAALEATYADWGKVTGTVSGTGGVSAEQTSMGLAGVGSLDLGPRFSVFAKAGFLLTEQKTPASSVTQRDETELHYGFGARFRLAPRWALRAEWERTDKLKVEVLSFGAEYRF